MLGGFCYLLYFCKKINDMEETKHIKISDYNYPLPDERIAKFPLPVRDQSKLLVYQHGQISETHFTSLPDYLEPGTLMIFNNTKVIQARLHFRKETGALIEIFCLEPIEPNDYVLNFQQTQHAAWLCMIGNLKKWKEGPLHKEMTVKGKESEIRKALDLVENIEDVVYHNSIVPGACDFTIKISGDVDMRENIFFALAEAKCPILKMQSSNMSLEEVFLKLTDDRNPEGRPAEEEIFEDEIEEEGEE
mgnify:CR=1 FL=1